MMETSYLALKSDFTAGVGNKHSQLNAPGQTLSEGVRGVPTKEGQQAGGLGFSSVTVASTRREL